MLSLFNTKTQIQKPSSNMTGLDLDDALFSIGVGSIERCREIARKLYDEGVSSFEDLRSVSEQDARGILSKVGLNKIQENKIIGAIQGISCQVVEPPKVLKPDTNVLANSLFSIGVDSSMKNCESYSIRLFDQGIYCLENLCNLSEQDLNSIISAIYSINISQKQVIISAISKIPRKSVKLPKTGEERTCFLLDSSGSVQNETNYFEKLKEIISESDESDLYVRWDSIAQSFSNSEINFWIDSKKGFRGTYPISSVLHIPNDFGENDTITMVSDGQIGSDSAQRFIQAMNARFPFGHKFKQIRVILINTGGAIDKSIVSAFTKYDCPFVLEIYEQNGSLKSREEENYYKLFDMLRDMKNLSDFTPELRKSIHNLALGCSSTDRIVVDLRSEIKRLMRKFQEELDRAPPEGNPTLDKFVAEAGKETISISVLTEIIKNLTSSFHLKKATAGNPLLILIQTISDLNDRLLDFGINSGLHNSGYGVSGLAIANASVAEEVNIDTCAMEEQCNFEDPIFGGLTIAIVPITQGDLLLPSGNISQIRRFPMLLSVKDEIFMAPIGLDGFAEMVKHSRLSHPLTRVSMRDVGFLIFPERATDEQKASIVKFNNSAIAKLLFHGKKVGDSNLFYFCFALRMLSVSFLEEHKPQIEEEIRWRLKNSTTCATLCGPSTEFPHDKMSIQNALIFTVLSACVCETSAQNPLLMHVSYLWKIKKLLEISCVKLPAKIKKHLELIQVAMKLLAVNKEDQTKNNGKMKLFGYRNLIGWKLITVDGSFYPTGVRLNEEEQLDQNEIFKGILKEIVGFPIEIDLFCSLYDLFIKQNDFLTLPHIPFGLQIAVCSRNFTLFQSTDEDFRKAVVDYVKGRKFDKLPSFEYVCSKLYITKPTQLLKREVWDELVANQLDTDEKIESFCETYKFVPKYVSGGSSYSFSGGQPRTQHSTRFGRKTRRRWLGLSKAEQMAICNGKCNRK
jgi:hypothetical protein